jgi:hypothetical protein
MQLCFGWQGRGHDTVWGDAIKIVWGAVRQRTWLGLIKYLGDVLKNTILALGKGFLNVIIIAFDLMEVLTSDME